MSERELPPPADVRAVLEGLLGRQVVLAPGAGVHGDDTSATAAVYLIGSTPTGIIALDLPAAARLGAALGLLPRGGADDVVDEGVLTPLLAENVAELLNVMAPLVPADDGHHGRLGEVHGSGTPCPPDVADALRRPTWRLDLHVDIAGYGTGELSVVLV